MRGYLLSMWPEGMAAHPLPSLPAHVRLPPIHRAPGPWLRLQCFDSAESWVQVSGTFRCGGGVADRRRGSPCCSWHRNQFVPAQSCSAHSLTLKALVMKGAGGDKIQETDKKERKEKQDPSSRNENTQPYRRGERPSERGGGDGEVTTSGRGLEEWDLHKQKNGGQATDRRCHG